MMENSFDDLIRQKALGHEAAVPPDAWENISKKKKKRRFPFFWWTFGVLLLAGVASFLIYNNGTSSGKGEIATQTVFQKDETTNPSMENDENKLVASSKAQESETTEGSEFIKEEKNDLAKAKTVATSTSPPDTESAGSKKHVQNQMQKHYSGKKANAFAATNKVKNKQKNKQHSLSPNPGSIALSEKISGDLSVSQVDEKSSQSPGELMVVKEVADPGTVSFNSSAIVTKIEESKEVSALEPIAASQKKSGTQEKSGTNSKWELEMSIMPILPIQKNDKVENIKRTEEKNGSVTDFTTNNIKTSLDLSIAYQLGVKRKINKKLAIGIGFQYAIIYEKVHLSGIETKTDYRVVQRLNNGSNGPYLTLDTISTQTSSNLQIDALNSYKNYSIPLSLQYNFLHRKGWSVDLDAGLYFNISATYQNNINGTLKTEYTSGEKQSTKLKYHGVDFFAGIRISKSLSDDLQLFIMPMFRGNLTKYDMSNAVIRKYINQAGISFGFSYGIN